MAERHEAHAGVARRVDERAVAVRRDDDLEAGASAGSSAATYVCAPPVSASVMRIRILGMRRAAVGAKRSARIRRGRTGGR